MAEQLATAAVAFEVNVDQLKAGIRAAQKEFAGLTTAVGGMDKQLSMAAETLRAGGNAHQALAKAGIVTTASINAQIAAIEAMEQALQGDAVATQQLITKKKALQAVLEQSQDAMVKTGASTHRANLFMINFSRGVEDLKFGLPAVINNLEGIALGYQMMAKEAEEAGRTTKQAIISTLTSPAGLLAVMNLAITTAYIFGGAIKKAFSDAGASAKMLGEATKGMLGDLNPDSGFQANIPKNAEAVRELAREFRNYAQDLREAKKNTEAFTTEIFASEAGAIAVRVPTREMADELRSVKDVSKGAEEELKKYADKLEATAIASDIMARKTANAKENMLELLMVAQAGGAQGTGGSARQGSIAYLQQQIDAAQQIYEAATAGGRPSALAHLKDLERQLSLITFEYEHLVEATEDFRVVLDEGDLDIPAYADSVDFLNAKLKRLTTEFNETGDAVKRSSLATQINSTREQIEEMTKAISKQQEVVFKSGSWGALEKQLQAYDDMLMEATSSTERMDIVMKMAALESGAEFERMLMDINRELKMFKTNAIVGMGDAVVGGLFQGFFGEFKKANATDARMAIADLNAEFADLEERLATGEISYAQFAAANAQRMRDLAAANKELSLAMRSDFELALARVGNAFQGMADMAKKAFQQIAQDYTTLLVRKGIFKLISTFINPASAVLPTSTDAVGNILGSFGGNTMARVSIAPVAAVVPSGDLQISLRRADATSFRTGV